VDCECIIFCLIGKLLDRNLSSIILLEFVSPWFLLVLALSSSDSQKHRPNQEPMSSTSSTSLEVGLNLPTVLTASALVASGVLLRGLWSNSGRSKSNVIVSPRETLLPKLTESQIADLPYPPDALPGARDIASPFGTIRAYEWGPEDGDKVLLVHGISTPCLALGSVAHGLVDKGHRVMLFDLFGRGYSDTPSDLNQDIRLFATEILLVLTSSRLSWTGSGSGGKFALLGYSLGAGISAGFASYFPDLINSLILIAPSGLIRPYNLGRANRVIYSQTVIPEFILHRAVKRRLKTPLFARKAPQGDNTIDTGDAVNAEINLESNSRVVLSKTHPNITVESAVHHQIDAHDGFVGAFMSSVRHGPIIEQHELWRKIGKRLTDQNASRIEGLRKGKVLLILGQHDAIIKTDEIIADATDALQGNLDIKIIDAGHEAPIEHGDQVVDYIMGFWELRLSG
jgi:pimeloyl-ACP methyl ester carboxylesterase